MFVGILYILNKLVASSAFDWVKIKFSLNETKKEITTDKVDWAKYSPIAGVIVVVLYSIYRIFYK